MTDTRSRRRLATIRAGVSALAFLLCGPVARAADTAYMLGPQDKVRLKVYEWRASKDEIFELEAFSDEFVVGPSGMLSLPLVGELPAQGLTTEALASSLADRLKRRLGLVERPDASAEVVQFRPFYVSGQVDKPGEYPYRPAMTVLQAVSLAGGLQRVSDPGIIRLAREAISSRGDLQILAGEINQLLVRRSRLEAEIAGQQDFKTPPELLGRANDAAISLLMQQERMIMKARLEGYRTQLGALDELKTYLQKEVDSLGAQLATEDTQLKLVQKELQSVASLVEKGLAVSPRQLSLERTVAQIQGDRLRVETAGMRARQEISKADISILELKNKRSNDLLVELRTTQAKLEETSRKANTTEQLLRESEYTAPQLLAERLKATMAPPSYSIVRKVNGEPVETAATETTPIEPGDIIKVQLARFDATAEGPAATPAPAPASAGATKLGAMERPSVSQN
ncbi:polysaccharide biosynthesis/export family protein [Alsobacter soli]|nr:polysaccharide biosynthesis/export family protein [Alsobacter soli]